MYASYLQTEEAPDQERLVSDGESAPVTPAARSVRLVFGFGSVALAVFAVLAVFSNKKDRSGLMLGNTGAVSGLYCGYSAGTMAGQYSCDQRVAFEINTNGLSEIEAKNKVHFEYRWACPGCDISPPTPAPVPVSTTPLAPSVDSNVTNATAAVTNATAAVVSAVLTTTNPAAAAVASAASAVLTTTPSTAAAVESAATAALATTAPPSTEAAVAAALATTAPPSTQAAVAAAASAIMTTTAASVNLLSIPR